MPGHAEDDDSFTFTKEPSIIEHKAYRDTWGRGLDSYLYWFSEAVVFLHELLSADGSLYVHLDYHVSHYAKVVLDEVFGNQNCKNEIVWKRQTAHSDRKRYGPIHDVLFTTANRPIRNSTFSTLLTTKATLSLTIRFATPTVGNTS